MEPIVFFGTEKFSEPALKSLIEAGWPVKLVVTKPDATSGRGRQVNQPAVKRLADSYNIKTIQPDKLKDEIETIRNASSKLAVLAAYGNLVPQSIIDLFDKGIVNIHPSKLPAWRGAAPIEYTILNGDKETAVALMKLVLEMDAGPIYASKTVKLNGHETQSQLYDELSKLGAEMLVNNLPLIASGELVPKDQTGQPTFAPKITKQDGVVDWNMPADQIERMVRAFELWPKVKTNLAGREIAILKARVVDQSGEPGKAYEVDGLPAVYCSKGALVIDELQPAGKSAMSGKAFLAGHSL